MSESDSSIQVSLVEFDGAGPRDGERAVRFTVRSDTGEELVSVQAGAEVARGVYEDLEGYLPLLGVEKKEDKFKSLRELTTYIAVQARWAREAHEAAALRGQRNFLLVVLVFLSFTLGLALSGRFR